MAKRSKELSKEEIEKLFYKLCVIISATNKTEDAAKLLRDLLSFTEAEMIAKRIRIAEMLLEDLTYRDIVKKAKTSHSTIFKVQEWLKISGEGYRKAIEKTKGKELKKISESDTHNYNPEDWMSMKRKFPMYYWPEILLENIIATSNRKQKDKIESVLRQMNKMKKKDALYRRIEKIIKRNSSYGQRQS